MLLPRTATLMCIFNLENASNLHFTTIKRVCSESAFKCIFTTRKKIAFQNKEHPPNIL